MVKTRWWAYIFIACPLLSSLIPRLHSPAFLAPFRKKSFFPRHAREWSLRTRLLLPSLQIAVEGCCHGELDQIYKTLEKVQEREGVKVELLICCGDFQAARNDGDLASMAVPPKYRKMNTFYKVYPGMKLSNISLVPRIVSFPRLFGNEVLDNC